MSNNMKLAESLIQIFESFSHHSHSGWGEGLIPIYKNPTTSDIDEIKSTDEKGPTGYYGVRYGVHKGNLYAWTANTMHAQVARSMHMPKFESEFYYDPDGDHFLSDWNSSATSYKPPPKKLSKEHLDRIKVLHPTATVHDTASNIFESVNEAKDNTPGQVLSTSGYEDTGLDEFQFMHNKKTYRVTAKPGCGHLLGNYKGFIEKAKINPFTYRSKGKHWKELFNVERVDPPVKPDKVNESNLSPVYQKNDGTIYKVIFDAEKGWLIEHTTKSGRTFTTQMPSKSLPEVDQKMKKDSEKIGTVVSK